MYKKDLSTQLFIILIIENQNNSTELNAIKKIRIKE